MSQPKYNALQMVPKKYSFIDIETTGGRAQGHKITEIAIINVNEKLEVEETFHTLLNPERFISSRISMLTGITNEMVVDAVKFYEIAKKVVEMTDGRIFVAHNVFFDYHFIKSEFKELGYSYQRETLCTVRLSRKYLPGFSSYSLANLCHDLGIQLVNHHRAFDDAKACFEIFKKIKKSHLYEGRGEFNKTSHSKLALPSSLNEKDIESLPESTGVYFFYQGNSLLYVGKSVNIKKRVQSHFRLQRAKSRELEFKSKIDRIEFEEYPHELLALIMECHHIKSLSKNFSLFKCHHRKSKVA